MTAYDLDLLINNSLVAAPGEKTLEDRLKPFMETSTEWFEKNFCKLSMLKEEGSEEETSASDTPEEESDIVISMTYKTAMKVIVAEAYRLAVPQLDIVLTANGFATVDSKNVVPASKARTDRLLSGLLEVRDSNIKLLLYRLPLIPEWIDSENAEYFKSTLFVNPEETEHISLAPSFNFPSFNSSWDKYRATLPLIADLEQSLAEEWFSDDLLKALRHEALGGGNSAVRKNVLLKIKYQILWYFQTGGLNSRKLAEIINIIKHNPEAFPEWINSEVAELFFPPSFKNKKNSTGYFF